MGGLYIYVPFLSPNPLTCLTIVYINIALTPDKKLYMNQQLILTDVDRNWQWFLVSLYGDFIFDLYWYYFYVLCTYINVIMYFFKKVVDLIRTTISN